MGKTRRILFVDRSRTELGGAEINLLELLSLQAAREGWESQVACFPGSRLETALAQLEVSRHAYHTGHFLGNGRSINPLNRLRNGREFQAAAQRVRDLAAGFRPDAVISCCTPDHFVCGEALHLSGIPSLWWVNEIISPDFQDRHSRREFAQKARKGATRVLPVSDFARQALIREGIPAEQVITVHNGISLSRYQKSNSTLIRDRFRLAPQEPLIGILGRFMPWKGQDFFLRLAQAWATQGRPGRFVLIGHASPEDAAYENRLREYVRTHRLENKVQFLAFQSDLVATLSQLDLLLHCSTKPEPFGRVILEAMAVGVPVIAARAGGVPEIVTEGVDAGLAEPSNLDSYLAQMTSLLGNAEKRAAWVLTGRRTVAQRFTLERVFADFERILGEVTAK